MTESYAFQPTHLDLFAGIGGFSLTAHAVGFKTVAMVEREAFCQRVLAKNFPGVPIYDDVRTFHGGAYPADLVTAGFPCQDTSSASSDEDAPGIDGGRSGLWWEGLRIAKESGARFLVFENVYQLVSRGLDRICSTLEQEGYRVWPVVLGASSSGAPHKRRRFLLVAHANRYSEPAFSFHEQAQGLVGLPAGCRWNPDRPRVSRVDDGLPARLDGIKRKRLAALGNAVVPAQAYPILKAIATSIQEGAK
jgi:DNA (cytosine-5)-methyltransferase 1